MDLNLIKRILKKEGYKKIRIEDNLGWDIIADNEKIEVKENEMFDDDQYEGQPNTSDNFALTIKLRMQTI